MSHKIIQYLNIQLALPTFKHTKRLEIYKIEMTFVNWDKILKVFSRVLMHCTKESASRKYFEKKKIYFLKKNFKTQTDYTKK